MCSVCAAVGCKNMPPMPGISFHSFPKDPKMRKLWVLAIKRDRWQPTSSSRLCSAHFTNEDYVHDPSIAERLGMKPFSRLLKPDAVPSMFAHNRKAENKLRGAFEKRRRKEVDRSNETKLRLSGKLYVSRWSRPVQTQKHELKEATLINHISRIAEPYPIQNEKIVEEALAAYAALSPPAHRCIHTTPLCHKPVVKCHHNVKRKALISTGSNTYILTRTQGLMTEGPLLRNAAVQTLKKVRSTTTSQKKQKPLPSFSVKRSPSPKPLS